MGSVAAARRAGTRQASVAAATSGTVTPPSNSGSLELSVTHFVDTLLNKMLSTIPAMTPAPTRSEEHTSELQSHSDLVCRLLLEKKKKKKKKQIIDNTKKYIYH